jgi:glycosyltransferase involved in cell wall biosynthesis
MRRYAFDIVHTHSSKPGVLGRIAARLAGVPVVLHTVHGFAFPATRSKAKRAVYAWSERLAGRFCDGVICVKNSDGASAVGLLGLPTERVHVFPNAVDTRRFQPLDSAARADVRSKVFGVARSTAVVGMVGRLAEQKNPLCFVRTAHAVLQRGLDAAFFLIGDGELRGNVEAEIARLGCTGRITVLGWRPDVPELLGALDLFVLPSRWEGLSLAILEAMACGVPVVASDIPGNRDAVVEGVDGWLAAPDNPASTAAAAVALLESESMRKEFGAAARQKIECEFNWDTRHLRITRLYESLLAGKFEP